MKITRTKIDTSTDDKILIGMIVSTAYLEKIERIYQSDLLESLYSQTVARWCLEHFQKYFTAPGVHIKEMYQSKLSTHQDADTMDLIGSFLSRISDEYEKAPHINADFLFDETNKVFKKRALKQLKDEINYAVEEGEDEVAVLELFKEYEDRINTTGELHNFEDSMLMSTQLINAKIKKPKAIIYPWLREKSLNMIFAERGIGKSWLVMIIAVAITRKDYEDLSIGPWYVKNPCGVLYVDGEMGKFDIQDRLRQLIGPLGGESRRFPLNIFCAPDYTEEHNETINLYSTYWQDRFYKYFESNRSIRILILDNLSSLCSGRDENDNQTTSVFTAWLIKLRALGVSVIIIHHQGKTKGTQRGASSLEDPLNNIIYITKPKDWIQGEGAHFRVQFTKARNDPGGEAFRAFDLRVIEHDDNHKHRQWTDAELNTGEDK